MHQEKSNYRVFVRLSDETLFAVDQISSITKGDQPQTSVVTMKNGEKFTVNNGIGCVISRMRLDVRLIRIPINAVHGA